MSKFEDTLQMSLDAYLDSLPEPDEVPKHKFSQKHTDAINAVIYPKPDIKVKKTPRKIIRFIIIAAVLLSLAVTAVANPISRKYIVEKFSNHSEYKIDDIDKAKSIAPVKPGYVPYGFEKTETSLNNDFCIETYSNADNSNYFYIEKMKMSATINYDTEYSESKTITVNGIDYICFQSDNEINGVIFNDSVSSFVIAGNIAEKELVEIAQSIE